MSFCRLRTYNKVGETHKVPAERMLTYLLSHIAHGVFLTQSDVRGHFLPKEISAIGPLDEYSIGHSLEKPVLFNLLESMK